MSFLFNNQAQCYVICMVIVNNFFFSRLGRNFPLLVFLRKIVSSLKILIAVFHYSRLSVIHLCCLQS